MSYSGTVTCSYCYNRGHNRRGCPDITEHARQSYSGAVASLAKAREESDEGNIEYYTRRVESMAEELSKRTGVDPRTGKKARKGSSRCGYCYESGHNRRGCPQRKADRIAAHGATSALRRRAVEYMKAKGLGLGAIVMGEVYVQGEGYKTVPSVIDMVRWQDFSSVSPGSKIFRYTPLKHLGQNKRAAWCSFDGDCAEVQTMTAEFGKPRGWQYESIELIAPLTASQVAEQIPADWLAGQSPKINEQIK